MTRNPSTGPDRLTGHALRNAHLREHSLARAREAPPLARALVVLRAKVLGMTRLEFARRSGISRGTLRDLELGIHVPTRRILHQFLGYCRNCQVASADLEEVSRLYSGSGEGIGQLIGRLELLAGSPSELARRAGISPATLWEYRRGNFPLSLVLLRKLCQAVGEDAKAAEAVWQESERQRFLTKGFPEALAEFWTLCSRAGYSEKHLPSLGLGTAALRRLRYLEMPPWHDVVKVARVLCRGDDELLHLEQLWRVEESGKCPDPFGAHLQKLRKQKGLSRREVANLFGIGGKKPARLMQSIEEEGCYSARAYPAGLAAILALDPEGQVRLLELWEARRKQFHRRHRPETRVDLRLARERYGFEHKDMEPILGYTALEYQKIERGVGALTDPARERIREAIHRAGQSRIEVLLRKKDAHDADGVAWRSPPTIRALVSRLASREGGIVPLTRLLRRAGVHGFWAERLRSIAAGNEVPPWPIVERIGSACNVPDLAAARADWREQYRARLQSKGCSPLGIEVRLLIAEVANTIREFSDRLGFSPSVLVRDLQRMDAGRPGKWFHVERILAAAGVTDIDRRWHQVHAWWYAAANENGRH